MAHADESVFQHHVARVQEHLKEFRDVALDENDSESIAGVAKYHGLEPESLRAFRDGDITAINRTIVLNWSQLVGQDSDITPSPSRSSDPADILHRQLIKEPCGRAERLQLNDRIDRTRTEASSALDAWADIVTTGSVTADDQFAGGFEPEMVGGGARAKKAIAACARTVNDYLLPFDEKWKLTRDVAKHGEQFEQVGIAYRDGVPAMVKLVNMPVATITRNIQPGGDIPIDKYYHQTLPGQTDPSAVFPKWKIAEFTNAKSRSSPEGISIFTPGERSLVQVEAVESSMVIRAIERASMRYKHTIDVSHTVTNDDVIRATSDYKRANTKVRTIDGQGRHGQMKVNMAHDADFIIAKRGKDSPADVSAIDGDPHMDQTGFYTVFLAKWLCGLGPPKAHLGYEDGVGRSVVTDQHIVFARKGRRMQMKMIAGLQHLYWVDLLLKGIDPRTVSFVIWPPDMSTRDEVMRAQVQMLQATTVQYLAKAFSTTGQQPSVQWFLTYVMGMDAAVVNALELTDVVGAAAKGSGDTPGGMQVKGQEAIDMAAVALQNPDIQREAGVLQFMVSERALRLRKPEFMSENDKRMIFAPVQPFVGETIAVAKSLFGALKKS